MKHNPVAWFEVPVTDLDRAEKFYNAVFGYKLERQDEMDGMTMSWFPMDMDAPGAAGSLVLGQGEPSDKGVLVYFSHPDIDSGLERVEEYGGKVLMEKTDIDEFGFMALIIDSEGNQIGLHTSKPM
ncbi:VOC family protein [Candidatus Dojkabacteria bacterium]|uniref:VOC family protein n=1 Tax=Candidatus Dojkabacteria bacterium TaxID=2099670 RepID=A0A955L931_9BACT|nr:VOC family protein [Candidatus Dojkabacteria bacterium]